MLSKDESLSQLKLQNSIDTLTSALGAILQNKPCLTHFRCSFILKNESSKKRSDDLVPETKTDALDRILGADQGEVFGTIVNSLC